MNVFCLRHCSAPEKYQSLVLYPEIAGVQLLLQRMFSAILLASQSGEAVQFEMSPMIYAVMHSFPQYWVDVPLLT